MPRYFLELAYKGTNYSGFQIQQNASSIQNEVQKALLTFFKLPIELTGSSRTDAGVHALQNYFHFDTDLNIGQKQVYNLNAILPQDIAIRSIRQVKPDNHSRFDAISRRYRYFLYAEKDPFLVDRAWFYPYKLDVDSLNQAAASLLGTHNFTSFSKKNTQVNNFVCTVYESFWEASGNTLVYNVRANRFLRGMVRGLVGTMLKVGRGNLTLESFSSVLQNKDMSKADFTTPAHGLFLVEVLYPEGYFI